MMTENLDGLFFQAGNAARLGDPMYGGLYAYSLWELGGNLRELRDRFEAGDGDAALREFFALYKFGPERLPEPEPADPPHGPGCDCESCDEIYHPDEVWPPEN